MKEKLISIKELRVGQVFIPETWTKEMAAEWKCIAVQIAHDGVVKAMCYLHDSMDFVLDSHVVEFFDMNVYPPCDVKPRHSCRGYKSQISLDKLNFFWYKVINDQKL